MTAIGFVLLVLSGIGIAATLDRGSRSALLLGRLCVFLFWQSLALVVCGVAVWLWEVMP